MAGIIKAGAEAPETAGPSLGGAVFNFADLAGEANQYLQAVQRHAAQIVRRARDEAEQIRRRAEQEGRQAAAQAAEEAARAKWSEQLAALTPALEQAVAEIRQAKQAWRRRWDRQVIRLAAAIAERVIRRQLDEDPHIPARLVRESLELAAGAGRVVVRLHPDDYAALAPSMDELTSRIAELGPTEVVPDPAIQRGGCRVETQFGEIDQQFDAQLARIQEELSP